MLDNETSMKQYCENGIELKPKTIPNTYEQKKVFVYFKKIFIEDENENPVVTIIVLQQAN